MIFDFIFSKKIIFALDIGSKYIKAGRFNIADNKLVMTHFEMVETPSGAVDKGVLVESALIHDTLDNLLFKKLNWSGKKSKFILSISGKSIITKIIEIPKTESKITKEHVVLEIGQYLPFDIEEAHYDYIELPFLSKDASMKSIFFIATNRKIINVYNLCLGNLLINVDSIDASLFSLQRVFTSGYKNSTPFTDENILILDLGFSVTGFIVMRNNYVIFSRGLISGVSSYLNEIQRTLSVNLHEAHNLLKTACTGQTTPDEVMMVIENHHSHFYRDISMGMEFFLNYFQNNTISKCFITGGGMMLPGLKEELSRRMEVDVHDLTIFRNIQTKGFSKKKLVEIQPFSSNCVGMALGQIK